MNKPSKRFNAVTFARAGRQSSGQQWLTAYPRLMAELVMQPASDAAVRWQLSGEQRSANDGRLYPALRLQIQASVPLQCQRCMAPLEQSLDIDRYFLLAPDEQAAAALDEHSDDDALVAGDDFQIDELVEDELLMALPLVPRHEVCPEPVKLEVIDAAFDEGGKSTEHPFAALAALRGDKLH